jgi:hypothetical protein
MDRNEIKEQARRHNVVIKDETTNDNLVTEHATPEVKEAPKTIEPVKPIDTKMDDDGLILVAKNLRREDQIMNHGYETHAWKNASKDEQNVWIERAKNLMNRK